MSHMIDETTGKAAIAYRGETPWHGLGQQLTEDASIETWTKEAGLDWEAQRANIYYSTDIGATDQNVVKYPNSQVLYRSDTKQPLGIVSDRYREVQPAEIMGFFKVLTEKSGFKMETAGALSDGKRIWALAQVGEGANIIGKDLVKPYVLLATSFDGTMATTAKFTSVRVVCNNTITSALSSENTGVVRINHREQFDAASIRAELGIATSQWDKFLLEARVLANEELLSGQAEELTKNLFNVTDQDLSERKRIHTGYTSIMRLFDGDAIGSDLTEGRTAWQWLNAVTEWVDWNNGRNSSSRMNSAWFGKGAQLKERALNLATELVA